MPIKTIRFMMVLLGIIAVSGRLCIAGTWIDDFSDRTLRDWGGEQIDDELSAAVVDGHFNYRGKKQNAQYRVQNYGLGEIQDFSLELKFMVRHIPVPEESFWEIEYYSFNEETAEYEGLITFDIRYAEPNVAFASIHQFEVEDHPEFGQILGGTVPAIARFVYETKVWYTLKIERDGNRYSFWIGDVGLFGLFTEDNSVPMGTIGLYFNGRCNIWLDDFTVAGPTVPDGGPGFLRVNPLAEEVTTTWGKLKAQH